MLIAYILIALFVAWIWVDYFRLIDIFEKNKLFYVLLVFALGACSVYVVDLAHWLFIDPMQWNINGDIGNDFLYSVFCIGLVEEIAKITPFILFYALFKKKLREPIDYIAFVCVSALGFSAFENVLYFQHHGSHIIINRSILCSLTHMFDTAIVGYGFVLLRFHPKFNNPFLIFGCLMLAAVSHGIYDFWLISDKIPYGFLFTLAFFFLTISIFATIINNCINNSGHFTYKKAVNSDLLVRRMFTYYGIVFAFQFLLLIYENGFKSGMYNLVISIVISGLIVSISVLRMSRFQLIQGKWNKIKFELPFHVSQSAVKNAHGFRPFGIRIKGPTHNEAYLANLFEEYVHLIPMSSDGSKVTAQLAFIEKKILIGSDTVHYTLRAYAGNKHSSFETILIKPKSGLSSHSKSKYPIVAKMRLVELSNKKKFRFEEWVYVKKV